MTGLHLVDTGKGGGARHHGLHQLVIQTGGGELARHFGVGEQHLEFGTEHQRAVDLGPVQRFDAEAVAHQHQTVFFAVIQREGEFAAQMRQGAVQAEARIEMQDDFGVTLGLEARAGCGQFGAYALVIVELAVLGQHQAAVGANKRLPAACLVQVDNRQPGMAEADAVHAPASRNRRGRGDIEWPPSPPGFQDRPGGRGRRI